MANISISTGTKIWYRLLSETFKPSRNWTDGLSAECTTSNYATACNTLAGDLVALGVRERAVGNTVDTTLITITLHNATTVNMGRGVVPMAKQSISLALSGDEIGDSTYVASYLTDHVAKLVALAGY